MLEIFRESCRAIIHPFKTFHAISDRPIPYITLVPIIFLIGVLWINLHSFLLFAEPIWVNFYRWLFYSILFGFFTVFAWLITALILWSIAQFFKVAVSLAYIERGTFYVLFIWILMPIFDIVHFWLPVQLIDVGILGIHPIHASHIFAIIFIPLEVFTFLYAVFGRNHFFFILFAALTALPVAKFVGEDLAFLFERFLYQTGIVAGKYDDYVFGYLFSVPFWIGYLILRAKVMMWPRRFWFSFIVPLSVVMIFIGAFMMYVVKPKFPGYATDSGYVDSSMDGVPKKKEFVFKNAFRLDSLSNAARIKKISCIVRFLEQTKKASSGSLPKARCDVISHQRGIADEFPIAGNEWISLSGASEQKTTWSEPDLIDRLTKGSNDIKISVETGRGDIVVFSGVWIETE